MPVVPRSDQVQELARLMIAVHGEEAAWYIADVACLSAQHGYETLAELLLDALALVITLRHAKGSAVH